MIAPHLLTCPERAASCAATLARWDATDWAERPRVHVDAPTDHRSLITDHPPPPWGDPARQHRIAAAFAAMLRAALHQPSTLNHQLSPWLLLLEDDLAFHPRIREHVESWPALRDPRCQLASLFNPSLRPTARWGEMESAFAAEPPSFQGMQAILLRRAALPRILAAWEQLEGLPSQRLAPFLGSESPLWIHRPSLVQHLATDSSWGARIYQALDFSGSTLSDEVTATH